MTRMSLRWYFQAYYEINRETWPDMSRRSAALDAFKVAWKVRRL